MSNNIINAGSFITFEAVETYECTFDNNNIDENLDQIDEEDEQDYSTESNDFEITYEPTTQH